MAEQARGRKTTARKPTPGLLFDGPDWSFETMDRTYDAIEAIALGDLGLDIYPNQIEIISSEQMLDAYSSTGMPLMYRHWSFGKSFEQLKSVKDLSLTFDGKRWVDWRGFRDSPESMFVVMAMPRVLSRRPYGANTAKIEEFNYEELPLGKNGESIRVPVTP